MTRVHTDFSRVPISVAPSPATSGTTLGVTDANAAYLPDTYPYWAVLVPVDVAPTRSNSEIVKVTEGSSAGGTTTLTIVRAQGIPVTTAQTVTTSFDIYDANSVEGLQTTVAIVSSEVPGGSINSSNVDFTSAASMATGSLKVYQNGIRLKGGGVDFTQGSGVNFTMVTAPTTGDTLLIDYQTSTGTFSTGSTSFVYNETPSGTVNGSNTAFDTASNYVAGSIQVYRDGQLMKGGGADYTETDSNTITFTTAPVTDSVLLVTYQSAVSTAGNADTLDGAHKPTGDIVGTSDTQTLTNKTLTSPKINEDVALTATSTQLNNKVTFSGALVYMSSNLTVNQNTETIVGFNSEIEDVGGWHDNSTNNSRLTVPTGVTRVIVRANVHLGGGGGAHYCQILKNGAGFDGSGYGYTWDEMGLTILTPPVSVTAGDYFELMVYQNQAATNTLYAATDETWFSIERVT